VTEAPKTYEDLRAIAVSFILPDLERNELNAETLDDETDLLATGIIDSFGFLDLMGEIEEKSGLPIELGDIDPAAMSKLSGLIKGFLGSG
jgi:acyl carrier protein